MHIAFSVQVPVIQCCMNSLLVHFQKAPLPVITSEVCGRRTEVDERIMPYG